MENVRKIYFHTNTKILASGICLQHTPLLDASLSKVKLSCSIVKRSIFFYLGYKIVTLNSLIGSAEETVVGTKHLSESAHKNSNNKK